MSGSGSGIQSALNWIIGISSIALVLIVVLMIFGNLSTNLGFAVGSQGFNDTEAVIGNFTEGAVATASQFPTVLLFVGIALLLFVLIAVLAWVIRRMGTFGSNMGGGSNAGF